MTRVQVNVPFRGCLVLCLCPVWKRHLWGGKGQGSASYAFSSKSRRSLCPDSLWTPHRRFSLSPTLLINVHVESDGLPGSIKGDVKREHFTSSSVRISFGIQPLIAALCCCFWETRDTAHSRSHHVRCYHDHKSRSRRVYDVA